MESSQNRNEPQQERKENGELKFHNRREMFMYLYLRIKETRKWWLLPVLVLLVILGFFLNLFTGYNVLPAIYSLIP